MVHLDYRDARPIYTQIIDAIKEQITTGVLMPGDKLPSVRELAGSLAINPNTIQRAYRELETEGWIASVSGKGSFVCGKEESTAELAPLWERFDEASRQLQEAGISLQALLQHLKQGGDQNA